MSSATIGFFRQYQADGVLLFNGEEVVVQRLHGEVALNSEWEEWAELDELRPAVAAYSFRALPQPLL